MAIKNRGLIKTAALVLPLLSTIFSSGISIYAKGNFPASETDEPEKIKVACVGNSITHGYALRDKANNNYPVQLGRMLGDKYDVGNFGRTGATLMKKGHNPYYNWIEYRKAIEFVPDIVVIHLGVNDLEPRDYPKFGDTFVGDYIALIDSFKNVNPDVRVIVANMSPLPAPHFRFKSGTRDWRDSLRNLTATVAEVTGAELIDFGTVLRDRPNLIPDNVHPDDDGATVLASTVRKAITGDYGGLQMPEVYGDHMVLQRYTPLLIKGTANAGSKVTVSLGNKQASDITNNRGEWSVTLPPFRESTGLTMKVTDGNKTLEYKDVAIGEVWLASGQSNMAFPLEESDSFLSDTTLMNDSMLRLFNMMPAVHIGTTEWTDAEKARIDDLGNYLPAKWEQSALSSAKDFSGVAWYFGKMLRDSLNIPIGIIHNAIGGSPTEAWIDIETLEHRFPDIMIDWRNSDFIQPWVRDIGVKNTGYDGKPDQHRHPFEPSYLYATGIRPLSGYPIAGVIWYQGESNDHNVELHEKLFPMLLDSWRQTWDKPALPFLYVQLSSVVRPSWPVFRDSQRRMSNTLPNVAMVVSSDRGDSLDIHPKDKKSIGERLGYQALNRVYSMNNITPQGPSIRKAEKVAPGTLILSFDYAKGLTTSDGYAPRTFEMAQFKDVYFPVDSVEILDDNTVKLVCTSIESPRFVRYAWQPVTRANLVNGDGLPASTFRIDVAVDLPEEKGIEAGVSAPYVGIADGVIIRAGGCNFPDNPLAPDSKKQFYQGIYSLTQNSEGDFVSRQIGRLPFPMAYGAGVTTPEGLIIIGGTSPSEALSSVYKINVDKEGKAVITQLPSMPGTIDNMAAAYLDGKIYVAGGNYDGRPSNELLCLDLNDISKGWKVLASFPGNPRVQPVLAGSTDGKGNPMLYLWGGFALRQSDREPSLNTDGLAYNPKKNKWTEIPAPKNNRGEEISTGGGVAVTLPGGNIVVVGGVNKDIFLQALQKTAPDYLSHPVEWYRFNDNILLFNPKTETWSVVKVDSDAARAGAAATLLPEGDILLIGGEIKPRIRTADNIRISID